MDNNSQTLLKLNGAIEALEQLLEWSRSHTAPITEKTVYNYLIATKKERDKLLNATIVC